MVELSPSEKKVLLALKAGKHFPTHIVEETGLEMVAVMSALSWLRTKNLVSINERIKVFYSLGDEGEEYLQTKLPEMQILKQIKNGKTEMKNIFSLMTKEKAAVGIGYLKELGATVSENILKIPPERLSDITELVEKREKFLSALSGKEIEEKDLEPSVLEHFKTRQNVLKKREYVLRDAELTEKGREELKYQYLLAATTPPMPKTSVEEIIRDSGVGDEISQITSEIIQTGKWKEKEFRKYDIHTFAPSIAYGKCHPLTKLANKIRDIFIGMGFKEIEYDFIQPCFWNMDALFVPQDHPARDVQDSFYIPGKLKIPAEIAKKVKAVHKKAWKYKWSLEESEKLILRTHTTVNTIRYLSENNTSPVKVFSIGRNFRREAIDATHLPEFTQIEGIVMEKGANFSMLLGVLKEFYKKIGFENISFRPSYFPFTEPSIEVLIDYEGKKLEMGGAGIFRPEVTKPFGIKDNVLAWGLGLERLAMLRLGLKDIRALYMSDLEWLRSVNII